MEWFHFYVWSTEREHPFSVFGRRDGDEEDTSSFVIRSTSVQWTHMSSSLSLSRLVRSLGPSLGR
jgi:hypothetical protein